MEGGRGGNATPEGTDQVQPRGASSNLPSGTRAQRSVLPGRGKAASIAQRRRTGQRAQGTQKEAGRGTDRRGKKGRPGRPTRGSVGGQLAEQCMQLPTGVGASRRRHLPGNRQGGPAFPQPSWSCWEPARAAASRAVRAAEGATHPLAHPGGSRWRNQLALGACQPQPQPAPVRATPARHRVGQEAAAQAAKQGSSWQGGRAVQGRVGLAQRRHKSKTHRG
jgi:hypothetical protein